MSNVQQLLLRWRLQLPVVELAVASMCECESVNARQRGAEEAAYSLDLPA